MRAVVWSFLSGLVFGVGLTVSQMINPAKVLAFLDITGHWDPTLAFVIAGALVVAAPGFAWRQSRASTVFGERLSLPSRQDLDPRLVGGAVLFGIGWGLIGFCPGPALAALGTGHAAVIVFVVAMAVGMAFFRAFAKPP